MAQESHYIQFINLSPKYQSNCKFIVGFVYMLNQSNGIAGFERAMRHPSKTNEIVRAMGGGVSQAHTEGRALSMKIYYI
jgi:hypothetical protein